MKFESVDGRMADYCYTISSPCLLWAFGSGELKTEHQKITVIIQ